MNTARGAWWGRRANEMNGDLVRFMRRRLPAEDAVEAIAAVHESLAAQFADPEFAAAHASWLETGTPEDGAIAEFDRFVWRLARLRQLDELRRLYVRKRSIDLDELRATTDEQARIEAREFLRMLADLVSALPAEERELLVTASDPVAGVARLTNAERVRVHRIRAVLAQRILSQRGKRKSVR
jgi:uncharacterized protein (DUF2267 family)